MGYKAIHRNVCIWCLECRKQAETIHTHTHKCEYILSDTSRSRRIPNRWSATIGVKEIPRKNLESLWSKTRASVQFQFHLNWKYWFHNFLPLHQNPFATHILILKEHVDCITNRLYILARLSDVNIVWNTQRFAFGCTIYRSLCARVRLSLSFSVTVSLHRRLLFGLMGFGFFSTGAEQATKQASRV